MTIDRVLLVTRLDNRADPSYLQACFARCDPSAAVVAFDASRGAAHVQFATGDHARHALNALNATPGPYGAPLALQLVMPAGAPDPSATPPRTKRNKLVVRNVASGVTGSLLRDAFAVHGTVTGVRLQQDRGAPQPLMAHVTFATADAAHAAQERTNGRLVLPGTAPVLDVQFAGDETPPASRASSAMPTPVLSRVDSYGQPGMNVPGQGPPWQHPGYAMPPAMLAPHAPFYMPAHTPLVAGAMVVPGYLQHPTVGPPPSAIVDANFVRLAPTVVSAAYQPHQQQY
jgi:hypothetical protein